MWDAFGGYEPYLRAPKRLTDKVRLILAAKRTVEKEQADKAEADRKSAERDARMQRELYDE